MAVHAVILAAGSSRRFGGSTSKAFASLRGRPVLAWSVDALDAAGAERIVVVVSPDGLATAGAVLATAGAVLATAGSPGAALVIGGPTRQASARLGLAAVAADPGDLILIHDAARPLADEPLARRVIEAVLAGADGAVPVLPLVDTTATVDGSRVVDVPDRSRQRRVQTPQAFRASVIEAAHRAALEAGEADASDDGGLVLRHVAGAQIVAVPGDERNLKITMPADLERAEALLAERAGG